MKKNLMVAALTTIMTLGISMTAFAGYEYTYCPDQDGNYVERLGYWEKDAIGWRWLHEDGTYLTSGQYLLDGNDDDIYEFYCFDENGYMYENATIYPYFDGKPSTSAKFMSTYNSEGQLINTTDDDSIDFVTHITTKVGEAYKMKHTYSSVNINFDSSRILMTGVNHRRRIGVK